MSKPILSVVIANYNYGRYLGAAMDSVLRQDCSEVELIVVDGGSTDNSIDVIRQHEDKLAWWVSERDQGQSDAFNKGFAHAKGRFLTWLNADDLLVPGCLRMVVDEISAHPDCEWFTGNFFRFSSEGKITTLGWGPHWYPAFLQQKTSPIVTFGPTTFFSKKIYEQVGKIDVDFHYTMDTDLWIRFIMAGIKQRRIRCFCWAFRMHAESKTAEFGDHTLDNQRMSKLMAEEKLAYSRAGYAPTPLMRRLCQLFRIFDGSFFKGLYLRHKYLHASAAELGVNI